MTENQKQENVFAGDAKRVEEMEALRTLTQKLLEEGRSRRAKRQQQNPSIKTHEIADR